MNRREILGVAGAALLAAGTRTARAEDAPLRVLCWSEGTEPKSVYPAGINGAVAELLNKQAGIKATAAGLADPDQGVGDSTLENTDVITWWGHQKHGQVRDDRVAAVVQRMNEHGLGVLALHSSHYSKILKTGLKCTGDPGPNGWGDGLRESIYVVDARHPVAKGVKDFVLPHEEYYDDPWDLPAPSSTVFFSIFEAKRPNGESRKFRSGMAYDGLGKGRMFYFRPGHEEYPTYLQPEVQTILVNAVRWLGHRA
jgi:trehalose utilization protein